MQRFLNFTPNPGSFSSSERPFLLRTLPPMWTPIHLSCHGDRSCIHPHRRSSEGKNMVVDGYTEKKIKKLHDGF